MSDFIDLIRILGVFAMIAGAIVIPSIALGVGAIRLIRWASK
jgi:hypothetical protein